MLITGYMKIEKGCAVEISAVQSFLELVVVKKRGIRYNRQMIPSQLCISAAMIYRIKG